MSIDEIAAWFTAHTSLIGYGAAGVMTGLFITSVLLRRRVTSAPKGEATNLSFADRAVTRLTGLLATGVLATGSWKLFNDVLHLNAFFTIILFAFAEAQIISAWRRARRHIFRHASMGNVGIIYGIALGAGALASLDADNVIEVALRFFAAFVASKMIVQELLEELDIYLSEHPNEVTDQIKRRSRIKWRATPERVLNWLGLADATEQTIEEAERKRRISRIARTARRLHRLKAMKDVPEWRVTRTRRKLDRLAERANEKLGLASDPAAIADVRRQLAFLYRIEDDTAPTAVGDLRPMAATPEPTRFYLDEEYDPAQPAQRPAVAPRPVSPAKAPTTRPQPAQRSGRASVAPVSPAPTDDGIKRDEQGRPVGTIRVPVRQVGEQVLIGDQLKADARQRAARWLAEGADRNGLGSRLAREYDPPMSPRWGQERVAEVPGPEPVGEMAEPQESNAQRPILTGNSF